MIRVDKDGDGYLIHSTDAEDCAVLAALYIWIDGCLGGQGVYTRQRNVGGPFFVDGFDLFGDPAGVESVFEAFKPILAKP